MAVQAQYVSHTFPHDFRAITTTMRSSFDNNNNNNNASSTFLDESSHLLGAYAQLGNINYNHCTGAVFSGNPNSDVTVTATTTSGRKRARELDSMDHHHLLLSNVNAAAMAQPPFVMSGGELQSRLIESGTTSTSGRPPVSPMTHSLLAHMYHQSLEIDTLIHLQNERLRSGLEDARRVHMRSVLATVERAAAKRLREADAQLEGARCRNAQLEEKVRQLNAEGLVWLGMAKNNENIAAGLRATLDEILAQGNGRNGVEGDAEDAESCCFEQQQQLEDGNSSKGRRACSMCGGNETCVLLLPCRHLCLCERCEPAADTCPICGSMKNAALHVLLS